MPYAVRALDAAQRIQVLRIEAIDEDEARHQARARGLLPLSVTRSANRRRPARFDLLLFAQELQALLSAGLGVVETLETLIEKQAASHHRSVLERLARQLREGQRLSAALRQQPEVFPPLLAGLVASGEGTGELPQALSRYVAYETRLAGLRQKVVSAAVYPCILLAVGTAVGLFLLGYVVPRFAAVYAGSGRELPWASALLMAWGQWADDHASHLGLALLPAGAAAAWAWRRGGPGAGPWPLLRRVPGLAQRIEVMGLSRLYLTLGMLVEAGIPVPAAMGQCGGACPADMRDRLQAARAQVEAGQPLSGALEREGLATPVGLRLMQVGERSGQLGALLARAAAFHDDESARWIERFARSFEPALMTAIGLVVGLIVVLLYLPVFELAGSLP